MKYAERQRSQRLQQSSAIRSVLLWLGRLGSMFLNHVDERRSAVIAVRSDSSSGSGVRLEPRGDRFGCQHESFAVRHRLTDQRMVAGSLWAAKSQDRQPESIYAWSQRAG